MLKIDLAAGFRVGDVLTLSRVLLDEFIGDEKAHGVVRDGDSQAVPTGEISFVGTREAGGVSPVGEVLQERRIEIEIGRASCRERVEISVVGGGVRNKRM